MLRPASDRRIRGCYHKSAQTHLPAHVHQPLPLSARGPPRLQAALVAIRAAPVIDDLMGEVPQNHC